MKAPLRRLIGIALLLAVTLGATVGCGKLTAPTNPSPAATIAERNADSASLLGGVTSILSPLIRLIVQVLNVVGSVGGTLTNGRWQVTIPAGSINGSAQVSLGVPSLTSAACRLEIAPVSLNHFSQPVRLTADCRSVPSGELSGYVIFWYDPVAAAWTPVPGSTVDLVHKTVSAPLQHFSTYAVGPRNGGRAGW